MKNKILILLSLLIFSFVFSKYRKIEEIKFTLNEDIDLLCRSMRTKITIMSNDRSHKVIYKLYYLYAKGYLFETNLDKEFFEALLYLTPKKNIYYRIKYNNDGSAITNK